MAIDLGIVIGVVFGVCLLIFLFEYRIRKPDVLMLYETKGKIGLRKGLIYPRHLSLPLERTTSPIRLTVEAAAVGNLEVRIKLVGSVAPSLEYIESLVRIGGWDNEAVAQAAEEAQVLLQGLVKEYIEQCEIHSLSSTGILSYLNERSTLVQERFGVELISLAVQTLEPTDPEISDALRQQEQARLLEQTEQLNNQARTAQMEHELELKKAELQKTLLEQESVLTSQSLQDELERKRMRLAFEKEELEVLKNSPELLMLTPQAARLAEASQNLKNARTIVSLTPKELTQGSELLGIFQGLMQNALEAKKEDKDD